jgi:hypothetical protein
MKKFMFQISSVYYVSLARTLARLHDQIKVMSACDVSLSKDTDLLLRMDQFSSGI